MDKIANVGYGTPLPARHKTSSVTDGSSTSTPGVRSFPNTKEGEEIDIVILVRHGPSLKPLDSAEDGEETEQRRGESRILSKADTAKASIKSENMNDPDENGDFGTGLGTVLFSHCNRLCECCVSLIRTEIYPYFKGEKLPTGPFTTDFEVAEHHESLGALRVSAKSGCHLCSLLDSADPGYPFSYDENSRNGYAINVNLNTLMESMKNRVLGSMRVHSGDHYSDSLLILTEDVDYKMGLTLQNPSTDAPEVLQLARAWLRSCLETHTDCRISNLSSNERGFQPTRLIKIGSDRNRVLSAHVISTDSKFPVSYLTLSHCWGGSGVLRITQSTLKAFYNGIPLSQLPKTFTDALQITVSLGYQYIWIDSLCTIQDSTPDWEHEARTMGDVYQHSVCKIAAAGSKNNHGGCFNQRSPLPLLPCQLPPEDPAIETVFVQHISSRPSYKPLHTRAWVVQERCLSVRTINFGAD